MPVYPGALAIMEILALVCGLTPVASPGLRHRPAGAAGAADPRPGSPAGRFPQATAVYITFGGAVSRISVLWQDAPISRGDHEHSALLAARKAYQPNIVRERYPPTASSQCTHAPWPSV
jgi:hypothetical protein